MRDIAAMNIEAKRKRFEAWAQESYGWNNVKDILENSHKYSEFVHASVFYAWEGWQAALQREGWIAMEDRLPDSPTDVLIFCGGDNTQLAFYLDGTWDGYEIGLGETVTHWMPLPQPPTTAPETSQ